MHIPVRPLLSVLAVAEHGSFSRAAEALGVTQPALSKSIKMLEQAIGGEVLTRSAAGSQLTALGKIIVRGGKNLRMLMEGLDREVEAYGSNLSGPLRIGATPGVMAGLVPEALARTAQAESKLVATVTAGLDDILAPALRHGELDLVVGALEELTPGESEIIQHRIMDDAFLLAVAADGPLAEARKVWLGDLVDRPWVLPTVNTSSFSTLSAMFMAAGLSWPANAISTNSVAVQERLICNASRIGFVSRTELVGRSLPFKVLQLAEAPPQAVALKLRKNTVLSPVAELFIEQLKQVASRMDERGQNINGLATPRHRAL
ncbi:LysR family transcriptional regulator [Novosphingobium sp. ZW T3_23]|uniref:LysR family transcriptional regulator n=1 Tax=Novosphingobium sp. ZW T3_23 TaxID=3378084 RepID=UPI003853186C